MKDCPICLESCEKDFIVAECCGNHFHTPCYTECMKINRSCPMCRHVVIEVEPQLVQVRAPLRLPYLMLICILIVTGIGTFCVFVAYSMINSYMKKGLNNTNSTNITEYVHN